LENFKSQYRLTEGNEHRRYGKYNTDYRRNCSSIPKYRYGFCRLGRGIRFFIERKERHYKVLDKNVFSILSELQPQVSDTVPIGDALPTYHFNIPVNNYRYENAVRHMKKEKGDETLDVSIENYRNKIIEVNQMNYNISQRINQIIEEKLSAFGYQPKDPIIHDIITSVNIQLKEIQNAIDVNYWAQTNEPTIAGVEERASQCLNDILKQEEVLNFMFKVRGQNVNIALLLRKIREKALSISQAIQDEDYDTDADCCPTFFKILRRSK